MEAQFRPKSNILLIHVTLPDQLIIWGLYVLFSTSLKGRYSLSSPNSAVGTLQKFMKRRKELLEFALYKAITHPRTL
jgi:hypothetical protein